MPLGPDRNENIRELTAECKKRGKFGSLPRSDFKTCQKRALGAAYSAERSKMAKKRKKSRHKGRY